MEFNSKEKKREPIFNNMPPGILSLAGIIVLIELIIQVFGIEYRSWFLIYFGFFPTNIIFPEGNIFFGQKYIMFFSYSLIHGSFFHMVLNVGILLALGKKLEEHLGYAKLFALFFSTAIFGAFFYLIILPNEHLPMVGASGSVFGFFGYWKGKELLFRLKNNMKLAPVIMFFLALILGNFLMVLFYPFGIAWQAHLGGLVLGLFFSYSSRFFGSKS